MSSLPEYSDTAIATAAATPFTPRYLKHPIKLRYYVGLTIVPSVVFVNLVPGSIGINVSLQSIIPASFRILHTYADCLIEMSLLFCVTSIPR
nr:hypothetical protein [Tanacetum cinerariifolium]GFB88686.1 hypothetical protein [Tanacetum cinerariifolium]